MWIRRGGNSSRREKGGKREMERYNRKNEMMGRGSARKTGRRNKNEEIKTEGEDNEGGTGRNNGSS
jgi:hypothetical protein